MKTLRKTLIESLDHIVEEAYIGTWQLKIASLSIKGAFHFVNGFDWALNLAKIKKRRVRMHRFPRARAPEPISIESKNIPSRRYAPVTEAIVIESRNISPARYTPLVTRNYQLPLLDPISKLNQGQREVLVAVLVSLGSKKQDALKTIATHEKILASCRSEEEAIRIAIQKGFRA